jgi:uncharacterized protein YdbL (DUF1318 family)
MNVRFLTIFSIFAILAVCAFGQSKSEIQQRMRERLPQLDALKAKEVVGENNRGLVEVRGAGDASASGVVAEENRDREAVYALIAKETGATPENVGKARAKDIAARSRGVWVQDESGRWAKK